MKNNPLKQLGILRQSFWLDYIRRDLIGSSELRRLIEVDGLRGMTSNPAIFEKAIIDSHSYDTDIQTMALEGMDANTIYEKLCLHDIQMAADAFRMIYNETDYKDGYVSLEVNPHLAHDTTGTIEEAQRLWGALNRPNVFIKIPGTLEGLPAIKQLTSEGININITLLFGLPRYRQVAEAYLAGIEERLDQGKTVTQVTSVASFFVSRIDTLIDPLLADIINQGGDGANIARQVHGKVAIASAQLAYQMYKDIFYNDRFTRLTEKGARVQRVLWASTGTKNPEYSDVKYIEALIGPDTINTMTIETLNAFRDHGNAAPRLQHDVELSGWVLDKLSDLKIDIGLLTEQLENEGVKNFNKSFDKLIEAIASAST